MNSGASEAAPVLIIGWGSDLRGDDAAGRRAAEAIAGWALPNVEALSVHQLTPELAEDIAAARLVLFIDASVEETPGEVVARRLYLKEAVGGSAHTGDPRGLLALAESVYGRCPSAWLVTVPVAKLNLGEDLSTVAERGLDTALGVVRQVLDHLGRER